MINIKKLWPERAKQSETDKPVAVVEAAAPKPAAITPTVKKLAPELGGQKGPEPTRYGDWEKNGRCTDF